MHTQKRLFWWHFFCWWTISVNNFFYNTLENVHDFSWKLVYASKLNSENNQVFCQMIAKCLCISSIRHIFDKLSLSAHKVTSLITHDRQFLLNIQTLAVNNCRGGYDERERGSSNPPFLDQLPSDVCRVPGCSLHRRKWARRRGKRGGTMVRLRRVNVKVCVNVWSHWMDYSSILILS